MTRSYASTTTSLKTRCASSRSAASNDLFVGDDTGGEHLATLLTVVANSPLAKLDAAQAALDRGDVDQAISLLIVFIREVQAQSRKHIVSPHDQHLIEHASAVIEALAET